MQMACIAPKSFGQIMAEGAWNSFYLKLMERDEESLNLIIDTLEDMIELTDESASRKTIKLWVRSDKTKYVNNFKIEKRLSRYLEKKSDDLGLGIDASRKFYWNAVHDISRCLKRIRDDKPVDLLPVEDQKLTFGFLERLKYTPEMEKYFY